MRQTRKSRLIFQRNSNRIIIREPSIMYDWPKGKSLTMDETLALMRNHLEEAAKRIIKICPHIVVISDLVNLSLEMHLWLEENTTDRFAHIDRAEIRQHEIAFKSKNDAAYFKLVWVGRDDIKIF